MAPVPPVTRIINTAALRAESQRLATEHAVGRTTGEAAPLTAAAAAGLTAWVRFIVG